MTMAVATRRLVTKGDFASDGAFGAVGEEGDEVKRYSFEHQIGGAIHQGSG